MEGMTRPSVEPTTLDVGDVRVVVRRKAIRNVYLRVKQPMGRVEVSAPLRMSDGQIMDFVRSKREWIARQQDRLRRAREDAYAGMTAGNQAADSRGEDGAHAIESAGAMEAEHGGTRLAPPDATMATFAATFWTTEKRAEAAAVINAALPGLLERWEPIVGRRPTRITLRIMSSRWGSCTAATGRIRLNLQLGLMDPKYLEYVLVHEMTHLWSHGHGADFQRHMDRYLPGWRGLRRELNRCVVL